jgi:hypothetical protein
MPKASKEQTLKIKLQARELFESGEYNTLEKICEVIKKSGGSISRQTLSKWINEDPTDIWQEKGKTQQNSQKIKEQHKPAIKEIVEKTLEMQAQKVQENNKIPPQKTSLEIRKEQAKENATQTDEIVNAIVDQFFEEEKLRNFVLSTGLLGMHRIRQVLLTNKQYYDGREQQIGLQSATHYYRLAQAYDVMAARLGFGSQTGGLNLSINHNTQINNHNTIDPTQRPTQINFISNADKCDLTEENK